VPSTEEGAEPGGTGILPERATADDTAPPPAGAGPEASADRAGAAGTDSSTSESDEDDDTSRPAVGLIGGGLALAGVVVLLAATSRSRGSTWNCRPHAEPTRKA
jgi:hypothetical protein